jgi:hypothetical protein
LDYTILFRYLCNYENTMGRFVGLLKVPHQEKS